MGGARDRRPERYGSISYENMLLKDTTISWNQNCDIIAFVENY